MPLVAISAFSDRPAQQQTLDELRITDILPQSTLASAGTTRIRAFNATSDGQRLSSGLTNSPLLSELMDYFERELPNRWQFFISKESQHNPVRVHAEWVSHQTHRSNPLTENRNSALSIIEVITTPPVLVESRDKGDLYEVGALLRIPVSAVKQPGRLEGTVRMEVKQY